MPEVSTLTGQHGSFEGCRTVPKRGGETPWREMSSLVYRLLRSLLLPGEKQMFSLVKYHKADHSISFKEYLAKQGVENGMSRDLSKCFVPHLWPTCKWGT